MNSSPRAIGFNSQGVLKGVAAVLVRNGSGCRAEVLLPLFGGVKALVAQGQVAQA
jgi:hypothetical protein